VNRTFVVSKKHPTASNPTHSKRSSAPLRFDFTLWIAAFTACAVAFLFHRSGSGALSLEAMNAAQVARNIGAGQGFSTSVLPSSNVISSALAPDFGNAPLFPFLLSWLFAFGGERDGIVSALSLACFAVSATLLFALSRCLLKNLLGAFLTVAAFVFSLPILSAADAGSPLMLSTALTLAALLLMTPHQIVAPEVVAPEVVAPEVVAPNNTSPVQSDNVQSDNAVEEGAPNDTQRTNLKNAPRRDVGRSNSRRYLLAGLLTGLCYLSQGASVFYLAPLLWFWTRHSHRLEETPPAKTPPAKRREAVAFALGLLLMVLPWLVRNTRLSGNPFGDIQWSGVLQSDAVGSQIVQNLARLAVETAQSPQLWLMPFVIIAFWLRFPRSLESAKLGVLSAFLGYVAALACLIEYSNAAMVPLSPLLALLGVAAYLQLSGAWLAGSTAEALELSSRRSAPRWAQEFKRRWGLAAFASGLLLVLALPISRRIVAGAPAATVTLAQIVKPLTQAVPKERAIVTDLPVAVAWYANRRAVALPADTAALKTLGAGLGAIYLSPQMPTSVNAHNGNAKNDEWQRIYAQVADLQGFRKVFRPDTRDIFYGHNPSVAELQRLAQKQPQNAPLQLALASAYLENGDAKRALAAFDKALQKQPSPSALAGVGMSALRLKDFKTARTYFMRALQKTPRLQPALLGLAEASLQSGQSAQAMELYARVLSDDPDNTVALNNLASLLGDSARRKPDLLHALEMARRAAARNPNNSSLRDTLGWICYRLNYTSEAVAHLKEAVRLAPDNGLRRYHLGKALLQAGQKAPAIQELQKSQTRGLSGQEAEDAEKILSGS